MANASQSTADLKGDVLSVKMFAGAADLTVDATAAIQSGLDFLASRGGGTLRLPKIDGGFYRFGEITIPSKCILAGEGDGVLCKRIGDIAPGRGWINIEDVDAGIEALALDGQVTTSVGLEYTVDFSDPMDAVLTNNSTIWVHPGAHNAWIKEVTITHTGGYAILIDAVEGDIRNVHVLDSFFENNRPHLFGTNSGDLNYGAWTGGIHYQGDCRSSESKLFSVRGLLVRGCTFRRITGVGCWGHARGFDNWHENVQILDNRCLDIGFHGLQLGVATGGRVANNLLRRIGYITSDDSSPGVPKYLNLLYASAIDIAASKYSTIEGNTIISANGDCFDLDGLAYSSVIGNACIIPSAGEPEYDEDSIGSIGPGGTGNNWTYGMQTGTTFFSEGGIQVTIANNTFKNMGGGAIRLYAAKDCHVHGNTIHHPAAPNVVPIIIGNVGSSNQERSYKNRVHGNTIFYDPASIGPAIYEDATIANFDSGDINYIWDNPVYGNCYEFQRHSSSGSTTERVSSSNSAGLATTTEFVTQVEGAGATAAHKTYFRRSSGAVQLTQLYGFRDGPNEDSVLNVSRAGAAGTGIVSTANRTSFGFGDVMATGKSLVYGFFGLLDKDNASSAFNDSHANALPDDWLLFRYNKISEEAEISKSFSGPNRVWESLVTGSAGVPGGITASVQYNDGSGVFGGDANFTWNKTTRLLTVAGLTGTAGIAVTTAYVQSAEGFLTAFTGSNGINASSSNGIALAWIGQRNDGDSAFILSRTTGTPQAYGLNIDASNNLLIRDRTAGANRVTMTTAGVVSVLGVALSPSIVLSNGYITSAEGFVTAFTGSLAISALGSSGIAKAWIGQRSDSDIAMFVLDYPTLRQYGLGVNAAGNFVLRDRSGGVDRLSMDTSGRFTLPGGAGLSVITISDGYMTSDEGYVANSASYQAIQAPSGGVYARSLHAENYIHIAGNFGVPTATSGDTITFNGHFYYDTSLNLFQFRQNGVWVGIGGGSGVTSINSQTGPAISILGTANRVTANTTLNTITLTGPQDIHTTANVSFASVTTSGVHQSTGTGATVTFQNTNGAFIVNGSGAVTCSGVVTSTIGFNVISNTATNSIQTTGGVNVGSGGFAGVYQVSGITVIDQSRNALNLASVTTSGNLSFGGSLIQGFTARIDSSGGITGTVIQATSGGITFQNAGGVGFQVNQAGVLSCQQLNIAGTTTINSSRDGFFNRVNVTGGGLTPSAGFNIYANGAQVRIRFSTGVDKEVSLL